MSTDQVTIIMSLDAAYEALGAVAIYRKYAEDRLQMALEHEHPAEDIEKIQRSMALLEEAKKAIREAIRCWGK